MNDWRLELSPGEIELNLDNDLVAALLRSQVRNLEFTNVSYLDAGWDSSVYETDTGIVFKFPKRQDSVAALMREEKLLANLKDLKAIPVPRPIFHGAPCPQFLAPFIGYKKLRGRFLSDIEPQSCDLASLARQAGEFLTELGRIEPGLSLESEEKETASQKQIAEFPLVLTSVRPLLPESMASKLEKALASFKVIPKPPYPACFTHSDLTAVHILVDTSCSKFSGVIDWADMDFSNPIHDFAGFYAWGGETFVRGMLSSYQGAVDERALPWLKQRTLIMGLFEAHFSFQTQNLKDRKSGLLALKTALEA